MMGKFAEFVNKKQKDPKRTVVVEEVSQKDWQKLIDKLNSIPPGKFYSVSNATIIEDIGGKPITFKKDLGVDSYSFKGTGVFTLQKYRVAGSVNVDEPGRITWRDIDGTLHLINYDHR